MIVHAAVGAVCLAQLVVAAGILASRPVQSAPVAPADTRFTTLLIPDDAPTIPCAPMESYLRIDDCPAVLR